MTLTDTLFDLKRSLAKNPNDRASLTRLGFELVSSDPVSACRQLARVIPLSPENTAAARINLGIAAESSRNPQTAELNYRLALEADPNNEKALRRLVRLLASRPDRKGIAELISTPDRLARLNDESRLLVGAVMSPASDYKALAGQVLTDLLDVGNQYFAAAAHLVINHHLHVTDDPDKRAWLLRVNQMLDPSCGEGAIAIARWLHRTKNRVRAAAWICQAAIVLRTRDDVLTTAAEESAKVLWPMHGIAANLRLHERFPGALPPLERLRPLYKALKDPKAAKATAYDLVDAFPDKPQVWDEAIKLLNEFSFHDEADVLWQRVMTRFPEIPIFHYNRGLSCNGQGRKDEAISHIRRALCLKPDYAKGWNGLSLAYIADEEVDEAIFYAERGLYVGFAPDILHLNLGVYYRARRRYSDSVRASLLAIQETKDPEERAAAHFNMGMIHFCCGEIAEGFRGYMQRWGTKNFPSPKREFRQPIWQGPAIHQKAKLLTYMEQGLGDEVMFSWYIPYLLRDVSSLVVDCDSRLIAIFERSFPGATFVNRSRKGDKLTHPPASMHKVPIGHVPFYYAVETKEHIARVPAELRARLPVRNEGYLVPDPDMVAKWRAYFAETHAGRKRIGVSWRSKIRNRARNLQYLEIEELATTIPAGSVVVNLQYGTIAEEVERWNSAAEKHGFVFDAMNDVDLTNDLDEIFAILKVIDFSVTPLLSIAWMSGSVGCPTLVNRTAWDSTIWQCFGTDFVPWQPSIRLFFRTPKEPWTGPLGRINETLVELVDRDG